MEGTAAAAAAVADAVVQDTVAVKFAEVWRGMQFDFETQVRFADVAEAGSPADL